MTSSAVERDLAALLTTFDLFNAEHEEWKYDAFSYAREHCPVVRTETELTGPMWMVTRYADVRKVLEDPETFSSQGGSPAPTPIGLGPLDSDPPLHTTFRKLLNPYLSRKYSLTFEDEMRSIARELVDNFVDKGKVELLGEFAGPFVSRVLASVVFKETDMAKMERAKQVVFAVTEDGTEQDFMNLGILAAEYLAAATENPPEEDGILKSLVSGTVDGNRSSRSKRSAPSACCSWADWTPLVRRSAPLPCIWRCSPNSKPACGIRGGCAMTWTSSSGTRLRWPRSAGRSPATPRSAAVRCARGSGVGALRLGQPR